MTKPSLVTAWEVDMPKGYLSLGRICIAGSQLQWIVLSMENRPM